MPILVGDVLATADKTRTKMKIIAVHFLRMICSKNFVPGSGSKIHHPVPNLGN